MYWGNIKQTNKTHHTIKQNKTNQQNKPYTTDLELYIVFTPREMVQPLGKKQKCEEQ